MAHKQRLVNPIWRSVFALFFFANAYDFSLLWANMAAPQYPLSGGLDLRFVGPATGLKGLRMERERVTIQLQDGWAAVKGTYYIRNLTDNPIRTQLGYPEFGSYTYYTPDDQDGPDWYASYIRIEDHLRHVRIRLGETWITPQYQSTENATPPAGWDSIPGPESTHLGGWYTFDAIIPAQQTVPITVYYWVPTWGSFRSGYTSERANGFLYLVETGAAWDGPISAGRIAVALPQGGKAQLMAFRSALRFYVKGGLAVADFTDLVPSRADNLLLKYRSNIDQAVDSIDTKAAYATLDSLDNAIAQLDLGTWTELLSTSGMIEASGPSGGTSGDGFEPESGWWQRVLSGLLIPLLFILGPWVLLLGIVLVLGLVGYRMYRARKSRKS